METTTNYKLPQWVKADQIKMDDFNGAFANIDAALKANADAAAGAASAAAVTALALDVGAGGKNCRVAFGSYTGTGKYGSANPNTLTFPIKPVLVVITSPDSVARHVRPVASSASGGGGAVKLTWGERSLSWYTVDTTNPEIRQDNNAGVTYQYMAFGYDE